MQNRLIAVDTDVIIDFFPDLSPATGPVSELPFLQYRKIKGLTPCPVLPIPHLAQIELDHSV